MPVYALDPKLAADTASIGNLDLSELRLMNDRRFAWTILIPRRPGLAELFELPRAERSLLAEEIAAVSEALKRIMKADKMNVAALGNQVRQLHVHVIARHEGDAAWPWPIWGKGTIEPYRAGEAEALIAQLAKALNLSASANTL